MSPAAGVLIAAVLQAGANGVTLTGRVREAGTGAAVVGAVVVLLEARRVTETDTAGRYVVAGLEPGLHHVVVRRIGYRPRSYHALLPAAGSVRIDVTLEPVPLALPPVEARARRPVGEVGPPGGEDDPHAEFRASDLRTMPDLPEADALQAFGSRGGVVNPEAASGIHVDGAQADEVAYQLDGFPIFNPFHAAGSFGAWNPDALGTLHLHTLGIPPGTPATTGGLVSATTRAARDRHELAGAVSTTQLRLTSDGPLGSGSYLAAVRSAYPGLLFHPRERSYLRGDSHDWLARLILPLGDGVLEVLGHGNANDLLTRATLVPSTPQQAEATNRLEWTGRTLGASWHQGRTTGAVGIRVWLAEADAEIRWRAADPDPEHTRSEHREAGVAVTLEWRGERGGSTVGLRVPVERTRYAARVGSNRGFAAMADRWPLSLGWQGRRDVGGVVAVHGGLSGVLLDGAGRLGAEAGVEWRPDPALSLHLGAAQRWQGTQSLRNPESVVSQIFPADLPLAAGRGGVGVRRRRLLVGAVRYAPAPGWWVDLRAHAGAVRHLTLVAAGDGSPAARTAPISGSGTVSGIRLVAGVEGARARLSVLAGLERVRLRFADSVYVPGHAVARRLEVGALLRPTPGLTLTSYLTALFGRRTTAVPGPFEWEACNLLDQGCEFAGSPATRPEPLGAVRLPGYIRLDAGARQHWHPRIAGRERELALFGTVTNLLGRQNLMTVVVDSTTSRRKPITMRPRSLLVAGLEWRF